MRIKASKITEKKTRIAPVTLILRDEDTNGWSEVSTVVEYYTDTVGNYREKIKSSENEKGDGVTQLAKRIASFPEIDGDDDKPLTKPADIENFLAGLYGDNVHRINKAIADDMTPEKKSQSPSSPGT